MNHALGALGTGAGSAGGRHVVQRPSSVGGAATWRLTCRRSSSSTRIRSIALAYLNAPRPPVWTPRAFLDGLAPPIP
jgi:hypothetical protein